MNKDRGDLMLELLQENRADIKEIKADVGALRGRLERFEVKVYSIASAVGVGAATLWDVVKHKFGLG